MAAKYDCTQEYVAYGPNWRRRSVPGICICKHKTFCSPARLAVEVMCMCDVQSFQYARSPDELTLKDYNYLKEILMSDGLKCLFNRHKICSHYRT